MVLLKNRALAVDRPARSRPVSPLVPRANARPTARAMSMHVSLVDRSTRVVARDVVPSTVSRARLPEFSMFLVHRRALFAPRRSSARDAANATELTSPRASRARRAARSRETASETMDARARSPAKKILITGARGGVAANLAANLARYVASLDASSRSRASLEILVHDPREYRFAETEDVESSGGALRFEDVGRDIVDAVVDAVNRYGESRAREGALVTARARASGVEGRRLDAEACATAAPTSWRAATTTEVERHVWDRGGGGGARASKSEWGEWERTGVRDGEGEGGGGRCSRAGERTLSDAATVGVSIGGGLQTRHGDSVSDARMDEMRRRVRSISVCARIQRRDRY